MCFILYVRPSVCPSGTSDTVNNLYSCFSLYNLFNVCVTVQISGSDRTLEGRKQVEVRPRDLFLAFKCCLLALKSKTIRDNGNGRGIEWRDRVPPLTYFHL